MEENYETIELTKPKRGGRKRQEAPAPVSVTESVVPEPTSNSTSTPVVQDSEPKTKKSRGRPKRTTVDKVEKPVVVEEVKPVVKEEVKPVVQEIVKPVVDRRSDEPKIQQQEEVKTTKKRVKPPKTKEIILEESSESSESIDETTFAELVALLEQHTPKQKKPTKQVKRKIETDDIEYRIDMVKEQIANKKIKKTKKENDYLKRKLAELEQELQELDSSSEEEIVTPAKRKSSKATKPIKIPKQNVLAQPQVMTRTEVMRSFGF